MDTTSVWQDTTEKLRAYPQIEKDHDVDVAIIGGGITGVIAAWYLVQAHKKVAIIEAETMSSGTTGNSTGNLYVPIQPYFHTIKNKFGIKVAEKVAQSRRDTLNVLEQLIREEHIDCNFKRRPWFLYGDKKYVENELKVLRACHFPVQKVSDMPLPFKVEHAISLAEQARFNPVAFVRKFTEKLVERGCLVFEQSPVLQIVEQNKITLHTQYGNIRAKDVFMATHVPKGFHKTQMLTAPYRSYVVGVTLKDKNYVDGNFWDTTSPHHVTSTHSTNKEGTLDLLTVADSHHKTGQESNHVEKFKEIETYLRDHYDVAEIKYRWSAQHYQSVDGLPYIGQASAHSKHMYIATGFFADGLIYGAMAAKIISDAILQHTNVWAQVYDSCRFTPLASAKKFSQEGMNVAWQYCKDYLKNFPGADFSKVKIEEGKVLKIKGEKLAVYRDAKNTLHVVSAVCPHLKGIVHWNNAEKTWDCPCHGSRFAVDGKVIEGPALHPLKKHS